LTFSPPLFNNCSFLFYLTFRYGRSRQLLDCPILKQLIAIWVEEVQSNEPAIPCCARVYKKRKICDGFCKSAATPKS